MIRMFSLLLAVGTVSLAAEPPAGGWPPAPKNGTVASVYDGDTMTLASGDKIRLRWVNTPELKPLEAHAVEARAATEAFVLEKPVTLLLGSENPRDGYGRIVSGIETAEGNLSLHLLELGLGHLFVIPPDETDMTPFLAAQRRAREARRGIWSSDAFQGTLHITSFHANAPGDDRENINGEYLRVCNITTEPLNIAGYRIAKASGKSFELPDIVIPAGHTFKIFSGKGEHQKDPKQQLEVYLNSDQPVWNNDADRATLYDRFGRVMDARDHEVKGESN